MTESTINLDEKRGMAAQKATEIRRLLLNVQTNEEQLRAGLDALEAQLVAVPAQTWPEAADKARYLLKLLAESPAGQDPRRQKLISAALADFENLSAREIR